jgi:hypothetical protein
MPSPHLWCAQNKVSLGYRRQTSDEIAPCATYPRCQPAVEPQHPSAGQANRAPAVGQIGRPPVAGGKALEPRTADGRGVVPSDEAGTGINRADSSFAKLPAARAPAVTRSQAATPLGVGRVGPHRERLASPRPSGTRSRTKRTPVLSPCQRGRPEAVRAPSGQPALRARLEDLTECGT